MCTLRVTVCANDFAFSNFFFDSFTACPPRRTEVELLFSSLRNMVELHDVVGILDAAIVTGNVF